MNTLHLTPSQTRRYAIELPVGDPMAGPAYGKRQMPVVVVALAASSFAAGVTAFAAAATMGSMIAAGAVIAGSALTMIGAITGNQKLAMIGGILTLGGGLATAAMNSAGEATTEGVTQAATEGAVDTASNTAGNAVNSAGVTTSSVPAPSVDVSAVPDAAANNAAQTATDAATAAPPQGMANSVTDAAQAQAPASAQPFQASGTPFQANTDPLSAFNQNNVIDKATFNPDGSINVNTGMPGMVGSTTAGNPLQIVARALGPNGEPGFMTRAGQWVKDNKELAKIGADFASGLMPSEAVKAQTDLARAQAETLRRRALWGSGHI